MSTITPTATTHTGQEISHSDITTAPPPQRGVKYICCGACRQWLLAPRDAVYVVCSKCQSVNNCNLVPINRVIIIIIIITIITTIVNYDYYCM
jgi:LSD1 subclass zinc finger protein